MVVVKSSPEYIAPLDANFKPQPKHGHLSELDPEFAKLKAGLDSFIEPVWAPELSLEEFKKIWVTPAPLPEGCPKEGVDTLTEIHKVPTKDGATIEVKVYKSKNSKKNSALAMRFHGGGTS
jgi:hypothetical protein